MTLTLLLIALLQDGPIQTAPPAVPVAAGSAGQVADPGPVCTFGGRPVVSPGCPAPPGRIAAGGSAPAAQAGAVTAGDDTDPWAELNRAGLGQATPGEGGYSRSGAAAAESGGEPPEPDAADCSGGANGASSLTGFDCALRRARARRAAGSAGSPGFRDPAAGLDIPAWAFADPARWELSQCDSSDDACRRQARNRLAMARAGAAAETPASGGADSGGDQNCRMVMRRSETGFGGSLSRVCGDEATADELIRRLDVPARPAAEPCDRPAALETQDAWIARCRALPPR